MYLNVLGTDLVVLNSSEAIADLLDKRSAIYSDKVTSIYVSCLFGQMLTLLCVSSP